MIRHVVWSVVIANAACASRTSSSPDANQVATDAGGGSVDASVGAALPRLAFEVSFALDDYCPRQTVPEPLVAWQQELIDRIPTYRAALVAELPSIQAAWDDAAADLLAATVRGGGHEFRRAELPVALFLCPRLPSMGTPLAVNVISYLEAAVPDIPTLVDLDGDGDRDPLPRFLLVAITYHELLHKYLNDVSDLSSSPIVDALPASLTGDLADRDLVLMKAHLHLFALRRWVYEDLDLDDQVPYIEAIEKAHGPGYRRAWELVHERDDLYQPLLDEIRASRAE